MKMDTKQVTLVHVNEDYIEMEPISSPNFFTYSIGSPPQNNNNREFEFQMNSSVSNEKDSKTSPADDLFYKGKLLPLHLPPRLQMVQNLIVENSNAASTNAATFEYLKCESNLEDSSFPFNMISPSESCRVSSKLNPDEYSFVVVGELPNKSLPNKKLKQVKQFWLGLRLKASRAYLKSWFTKSGCSDKSCASAANNNNNMMGGAENSNNHNNNKYMKVNARNKKNPFEIFYDDDDKQQMKTTSSSLIEDDLNNHRKSFSGVVQRHCGGGGGGGATKASSLSTSSSGSSSSSSSFSLSSSGYYDLQFFKRSISANSELESSIEGAIAHCKQSCGSKIITPDDSRICSQFATKIDVCGNKETATLSRTVV